MYIPEKHKNRQITLFDFNQSCGMELDSNNEWIKLANALPWSRMESKPSNIRCPQDFSLLNEARAKYDVSIDEKGHARLEKVSFDPCNESTIFADAMNRYKERTGHYSKRILVDPIYRTRDNRNFCRDHNKTM